VWIFAGAPYAERLRENARAAGALAFVSAAVLGVIAKLALFFGAFALFAQQTIVSGVTLPDVMAPKLWAIALAVVAALALMRWKAPLLVVLAVCGAAGWGAWRFGL
jgi:chromate transporter